MSTLIFIVNYINSTSEINISEFHCTFTQVQLYLLLVNSYIFIVYFNVRFKTQTDTGLGL